MENTKFGRLTFIDEAMGTYYGASRKILARNWRCACDCGAVVVVLAANVKKGATTSCGCYRKNWAADAKRTHGLTQSPEYRVWSAMKRRCNNPNTVDYKRYGARGIKVCDRWTAFENFLDDMGRRPTEKHTIERINVDGDYTPENCIWATQLEQANNKSTNRRFEYGGKLLTIAQIARLTGINATTVRYRLISGIPLSSR